VTIAQAGQQWARQHRGLWPPAQELGPDASGLHIRLRCIAPWQRWQLGFTGLLAALTDPQMTVNAALTFTFQATQPVASYPLGAYEQAQQEGRFTGELTLGAETLAVDWSGYRDHSWGVRPTGAPTSRWTVATLPGQLYATMGERDGAPVFFGRVWSSAGEWVPLISVEMAQVEGGWQLALPKQALSWTVARTATPFRTYLGAHGQEALRATARAGDWAWDDFGPARFTAADGATAIGFLEQGQVLIL